MILPNTLDLFRSSLPNSIIDDTDESIISSTSFNELFKNTQSIFDLDRIERANTQSLNISGTNSSNRSVTKNKDMFKTSFLEKKRGRIGKGKKKKEVHDSKAFDNILRKIQTHFLNFIVSFLNDCILAFSINKKYSFKKFDYELKKDITSENLKMLKRFTIGDILNYFDISNKYKKFNRSINKENMKHLIKFNANFKKIFAINYLELFNYYYNNGLPLKEVFIQGKTILLSKKTKSFYYLVEEKKNKNCKEFIIVYAKMAYIDDMNFNESF